MELSTATEPARLDYPQQRLLTYRLTMTTGAQPQRLSVQPSDPPFSARQPVTLEGPGTLGYGIHADPGPRQLECPRDRTPIMPGQFYTVSLPAHSTSVLVSRYALLRAPWPGADLSVRYAFDSFSPIPSEPITFTSPAVLHSPKPVLGGVSGVRITLSTRPAAKVGFPGSIVLGQSVLIVGRTFPRLPGQVIVLRASRYPASVKARTIGHVRIRPDGSFQMRWRPQRRGSYGIYAVYRSRSPQLSNDSTPCNLPIRVRASA